MKILFKLVGLTFGLVTVMFDLARHVLFGIDPPPPTEHTVYYWDGMP